MPPFLPGLELSRLFFEEAVCPILSSDFPGVKSSAALLGAGSEVLGFDTEMSTDHDWGPCLQIFLSEADVEESTTAILETLRYRLPPSFRGYPTNFSLPDLKDNGTRLLEPTTEGPVNHRVSVTSPRHFFKAYLDFDLHSPLEPVDWLTFPEQKLRTIVAGAIYHDEIGLRTVCNRFATYPEDVWYYLLACGWKRIGQEDHLMGRAGFVGDEIGSAIIGARLVRDIMRLCFLMERQYAPYPKWFGTAFQRLHCAESLSTDLEGALHAENWQIREQNLSRAFEKLAGMHNALQITPPQPIQVTPFHGRPFQVINGDFPDLLCSRISDPELKRIASLPLIGGIDQFSDSTDLLSNPTWRDKIRTLFE